LKRIVNQTCVIDKIAGQKENGMGIKKPRLDFPSEVFLFDWFVLDPQNKDQAVQRASSPFLLGRPV